MFILILTYKKPLSEVDRYLDAHKAFLDAHYSTRQFVASGRQQPRTGGVILCRSTDRATVEKIIAEDPLMIHQIADYTVIEFCPSKYLEGFDHFL